MARRVETWGFRQGKLVRLDRNPRLVKNSVQTATATGVVSTSVFTGGTTVAPLPYPTYTDYPVVKWEVLDPQYSQRNLNSWAELPNMNILKKLTSRAYVELPEGFRGKVVGFTDVNYYGVYAPNCMGMWGKGPEKAIIRLEPYSSTIANLITPQPVTGAANGDAEGGPADNATIFRLGPTGSAVNAAVHNYGWTLMGTNQPDQAAGAKPGTFQHPHNYSGIVQYMGTGSTDHWMVIGGCQGDWNSPPGEKFQYAMYRTKTQSYARYVEITGFNEGAIANGAAPTDYQGATGERVGGGIGNNGGYMTTYENCNFHDAFVSGLAISGAGGPNGTLSNGFISKDVKLWNNANNQYPNPGGRTFGGLNHEGTVGVIRHERPDFKMGRYQNNYHNPHIFFGNWVGNQTSIDIIEPIWEGPQFGSPAGTWVNATNGCLIISQPTTYAGSPNTSTMMPRVVKDGVVLQPLIRPSGQGWPSGGNPRTHYMLVR